MSMNNPWRGLASYDDPANINKEHYEFCGRDDEASQLVRLIDNSLFVTLYGRTGVGKTSLLKAGVFPVLRLHHYFPLYIRLSQGGKDKSYAEIIVAEIEKIEHLKAKRQNDADLINNDGNSSSYLWDYFCQTKFYNEKDSEVYPVLVLDQFEEIFVSQDPKEKEKADLLLRQVYALLSDDYVLLDKENFSDETNYRFVASIREDNLYLLEDCIDELSLSVFKENRYRLRPMKEQQARNAVLIPGKDCIEEKDKDTIASLIIEVAKDIDGTISSLMLSFICSQLYEKAEADSGNPLISIKLFNEHLAESKRLLSQFYLQHTSKKQRKIIEENFLTEDGHRKQSNVTIPHSGDLVHKYKIMQDAKTENGEGLEIVHDKLAEVVYMHRRQMDSKKFRYALCCVLGFVLVALFGLSIFLSWTSSVSIPYKLAINKKPISINVDSVIDDKIVNVSYNAEIKNVYIGENADSISSLSISNEQRLFVSPKNKKIKSDYVYRYNEGDSVQYLYYIDHPEIAIWTKKYISDSDSLRLPKGIAEIEVGGGGIVRASRSAPYYGERDIVITKESDFKYIKQDKRIQTLTIRNVSNVPDNQFKGCINLTCADLGVDEMELASSCFKGCVNLHEVIFPKRLMGYNKDLFYGCGNLEKITLPDEVEYPDLLDQMFKWCSNIQEIEYHDKQKTHFWESDKGIIYYDSIPAIFSKCKVKDWASKDSIIQIVDAIILKGDEEIGILPAFWKKDHYSEIKKARTSYIITQKENSTTLDLPLLSWNIIYANYNPNLIEIHSQIADPKFLDFKHPCMDDMSGITLYVPYGCREAYVESGKFSDFKDIKEDTCIKRVSITIKYFWDGITWTFKEYAWLYPLVIFLLVLLAFIFYKLRVYQMERQGVISRGRAVFDAIYADFMAIIGYVPVYWLIYVIASNHYKIEKKWIVCFMAEILIIFSYFAIRLMVDTFKRKIYWTVFLVFVILGGCYCIDEVIMMSEEPAKYYDQIQYLSAFCGGLSGYLFAYLAVFAGNGRILSRMKRWKGFN